MKKNLQFSTTHLALFLKSKVFSIVLFGLLFLSNANAQVATEYTWSYVAGSYIPITGGTVVVSGTVDDAVYPITLPTGFSFNGTNITNVTMSSNGFLSLNGNPAVNDMNAISNNFTATGNICAMSADLQNASASSEMRWQEIGNEIIFQWKEFRRFGEADNFSFQIVINTFTGEIKTVYNGSTTIAGVNSPVAVGLRGATNADFNARRLTTSVPDSSPSWVGNSGGTTAATVNTHTVRLHSTASCYPTAGLTYVWTPTDAFVDWANLQWISNTTPYTCQSVDIYSQGYEPGVTNSAGAGAGVSVWIGRVASATDSDPSLWPESAWTAATYFGESGNNDEFKLTLSGLAVGSYRIATRWKINSGPFKYGATNNGFYNETTNPTGLITVTAPPVINATATPSTPICAGTSVTLSASSSGSYNYAWNNGAGNGASVTVSPSVTTTYTVTGTDTVSGCTNTATVTVTVTPSPTAINITNADATVCQDAVQTLTVTGGAGVTGQTATASSGTVNLAIPDSNLATGVAQTLAISGIPTGATITKVDVNLNITHTWDSDLVVNLEGPNGQIVNLIDEIGGSGDNFTNTVVTSNTAAAAFSTGTAPFTGTFKADLASQATIGTTPSVTSTTFSSLYTVPNGNWKVRVYDDAGSDLGTLLNCSITITYDAPSTITWSPITDLFTDLACTTAYTGTNATTVYYKPSSNVTYTATAAIGSCTTTDTVAFTVTPLATASISGNNGPTLCNGSDATFTLTGTDGASVNYNINGGATQSVTLTGGTATVTVSGITSNQTLNLVSVTHNSCTKTLTGSSTVNAGGVVTYNSGVWSPAAPTGAESVVIAAGSYTTTANFTACSLTIDSGATFNLAAGHDLILTSGALTVNGTYNQANTANFIQNNASAANTAAGIVNITRNSSSLFRLDYTIWSAPTTGSQTLLQFSPSTLTNRFYTYNTATDLYNAVTPSTTTWSAGKGFLIRMPDTWSATTASPYAGIFTGVPNNGTQTYTMSSAGNGYNSVGNPYPSPINVTNFIDDNTGIDGTLYFWRKTNNTNQSSYATLTKIAYTANTGNSGGDTGTGFFNTGNEANWVINLGQGFLVKANGSNNTLTFNNAMRRSTNTNQFFRPATSNLSLYKINLTNETGMFSQMAVGYTPEATMAFDRGLDGININATSYITTLIGSDKYAIQARPEFIDTDVVPVAYKVPTAGNYSIAIADTSGVFAAGQQVFVYDTTQGTYHDLATGAYTFATAELENTTRLQLVYRSTALGTVTHNIENVVVFKQQDDIVVNAGNTIIQKVKVFDMRGRLLIEKNNVNATEVRLLSDKTQQVLLVQVTSTEGKVVTKKIVN